MTTSVTNTLATTTKLAKGFIDKFESKRVLSKTVNTQLLDGKFDPSTGSQTDFKRPTDYITQRTSGGDISSGTRNAIIVGRAHGTVQDMFTVDVDFSAVEEALEMDQLDMLLDPMAQRIVTDLELDFGAFMTRNVNLSVGDPDTAISSWDEVAEAGALMESIGVPHDKTWNYVINPYTQTTLSNIQRTLGAADPLVSEAFRNATISDNFGGLRVMTSPALASFTSGTTSDRAGTITTVDVTYATAKDTMTQAIGVTAMTTAGTIKAGEIIEVTGKFRNGLATRNQLVGKNGAALKWRGTVTADVTLSGGAGTLIVAGPAIFESAGQFNTTSAAIATSDVITLLGTASTIYQPNMFYHPDAFSIGSVPQKKLFSTDTLATTKDGLQIRVSKYADGDKNKQIVRFDLHPAYAVLNPFFAGQGFGNA